MVVDWRHAAGAVVAVEVEVRVLGQVDLNCKCTRAKIKSLRRWRSYVLKHTRRWNTFMQPRDSLCLPAWVHRRRLLFQG